MTTITFSYFDHLSGADFLDLTKRYAKAVKKVDPEGNALSWHQDKIAISLGFKNWSQLHKHLISITWIEMERLKLLVLKKPRLGRFIKEHACRTIDKDVAIEAMKEWARRKYTPLIEFAFYDNESETGFSWPEVDMAEELYGKFAGRFPDDLIEQVGNELDVNEGPWGLEEFDE